MTITRITTVAAKTWHPIPERMADISEGIGICRRCGASIYSIARSSKQGFYQGANHFVNCTPKHDTA